MASSVVAAEPWIVKVVSLEIAAANSSLRRDFAVPGSPISIRPRFVASDTTQRSTRERRPTYLLVTSWPSPSTNSTTDCAESCQPGATGRLSFLSRCLSSSSSSA